MKLFISADLEGVCDGTSWDETNDIHMHMRYQKLAEEMSKEVRAACDGARDAGVDEITVRDAHGSAMNIDPITLDEGTLLIRGWGNSPLSMMYDVDKKCDAAAYIGYHSPASQQGNPMAHTINGGKIYQMFLNGALASEMILNVFTAAYYNVPSIFLSGDAWICKEAERYFPAISTVVVKDGEGGLTTNISPIKAQKLIRKKMQESIKNKDRCYISLPKTFLMEILFKKPQDATKASFYPGATIDNYKVTYKNDDFYEILRFLMFSLT